MVSFGALVSFPPANGCTAGIAAQKSNTRKPRSICIVFSRLTNHTILSQLVCAQSSARFKSGIHGAAEPQKSGFLRAPRACRDGTPGRLDAGVCTFVVPLRQKQSSDSPLLWSGNAGVFAMSRHFQ